MEDDLLENARRQAENADASVRAAALLRIARAESGRNVSRAQRTLLEGLDAVQKLPKPLREHLLDEGRQVAAAIAPELVGQIPATDPPGGQQFASARIISTMIAHGHVDASFSYLLKQDDPESFPFLSVGGVLHQLDRQSPEGADRGLILLRHALRMWRQSPSGLHSHERDQFVQLFGFCWKEFPVEEASAVARMVVDRALAEKDITTSSQYGDEIHFSSRLQDTLFQMLPVLRHLNPALAQSLVDSHNQLAAAARRYPNGMETMIEEADAKAKRRKAGGAICESGGYVLAGDPSDFDRQRRLVDATRGGDFARSIEDALEKYREDTSPVTRNYAPKECWPSTGVFRTVFYRAGKRLGAEAAKLLEHIPDDNLRLFASIELAAAIAGVPEPAMIRMMHRNPQHSRGFEAGQIASL